ncbi:MAG: glycosyltransferase family 4 protein [Niabella sp.]
MPAVTGGEKGIFLFLKHVARHARVTCFSVSENKDNSAGIGFFPLLGSTHKKWRYIDIRLFFSIKKTCKNENIGHIMIEHPYYAWLGYLLKKFAGLKLIVHSHNIEAARFKTMRKRWWRILYSYEKFAHQNADFNFFITEEDRKYAIQEYKLKADKCAVITYGIETAKAPGAEDKALSKRKVYDETGLPAETKLILFNGTLDYLPNRDGLDRILNEIGPVLEETLALPYKIIICGMRLPDTYNKLKAYESHNIIYKGFVEDVDLYFKAADLFINPIIDGGGIKTKLVEALAANTPSISFKAGAYGIPFSVTGNNLSIIPDGDSKGFAESIINRLNNAKEDIPSVFYDHFNWDAIARKAVGIVSKV